MTGENITRDDEYAELEVVAGFGRLQPLGRLLRTSTPSLSTTMRNGLIAQCLAAKANLSEGKQADSLRRMADDVKALGDQPLTEDGVFKLLRG